jgi:hypothetical protein
MEKIYEVRCWDGLRLQEKQRFMIHLGIQVILRFLPKQFQASVLVLPMGGIYEICYWNGLRWHDVEGNS